MLYAYQEHWATLRHKVSTWHRDLDMHRLQLARGVLELCLLSQARSFFPDRSLPSHHLPWTSSGLFTLCGILLACQLTSQVSGPYTPPGRKTKRKRFESETED